jgi:hypothetical protein
MALAKVPVTVKTYPAISRKKHQMALLDSVLKQKNPKQILKTD